jgi:hypothetical protein
VKAQVHYDSALILPDDPMEETLLEALYFSKQMKGV